MKNLNLTKFVSAGVLAAGLAVLPLTSSASAQTTTGTGNDTTTTQGADTTDYQGDRDFDWGWLGLLGLAGLAGLAKRNEPARYREPDEVGSYRR